MPISNPCIDCGALTRNGTRCEDCATGHAAIKAPRTRPHPPKKSAAARGYDAAWKKLSKKARLLQPFCSDCGTSEDLQADHLPQAWQRKAKGLPIRLEDIDVVCGRCNRKRGAARGEAPRSPAVPLGVKDPNWATRGRF